MEQDRKKGSVTVNDVWGAMMFKLNRFKDEKRVGAVSHDEENGAIVFHRDDQSPEYRYWIPFDELQDFEGQLRWLYHIRGKGWFDTKYFNDFLDVLEFLGLRPPT